MGSLNVIIEGVVSHYLLAALATVAVYVAYIVVYRLYFHPLAKFPGPKFAAATYLYEFYYDNIVGHSFVANTRELHKRYGPIVRINPDELSASDPEWIDIVYAGGGKRRNKSPLYCHSFGVDGASFSTMDHDTHRMRRNALNRYFSKQAVTKVEPMVHEKAHLLCDNFLTHSGSGHPIDISNAFSCLTTDVVTGYIYSHSFNLLGDASFRSGIRYAVLAGALISYYVKYIPGLLTLMNSLPDAVVAYLMPSMRTFHELLAGMHRDVKQARKEFDSGISKIPGRGHPTIFNELLLGDLPEHEKSDARLTTEAHTVIGAGTETTAWSLTVLTVYLLSDPARLAKLRKEVIPLVPNSKELPSWNTLEHLPYLHAVIMEGLRLSIGVAYRLPRCAPDEVLRLTETKTGKQWLIPPNTPISIPTILVHENPDIFPQPDQFIPERWLNEDGSFKKELEKYLVSFSRGSRQCLGMQLAQSELYIGLTAMLVRVYDRLQLHETSIEDVAFDHDAFVPMPKKSSKGTYVTVV